MGNICSCANGDEVQQAAAPGTGNAASAQRAASSKTAAAPKVPTPQDIIDESMADAKSELEKNKGMDVHDTYKVSKLVGHGAFAKVMICTHKDTHEKFAVKTVQKNLEDPQKQREGEFICVPGQCVCVDSVRAMWTHGRCFLSHYLSCWCKSRGLRACWVPGLGRCSECHAMHAC